MKGTLSRRQMEFGIGTLGLLLSVGLLAAGFMLMNRTGADALERQAGVREWPSFEMIYAERAISEGTGRVLIDRIKSLNVTDDFTWQEEVTRDAVNPEEVGSSRSLSDGTFTTHDAMLDVTHQQKEQEASTVSIAPFFYPTAYVLLRDGVYLGEGFRPTDPSIPGRAKWVRSSTVECSKDAAEGAPLACSADQSDVEVVEQVEFDVAHIGDQYHGGVTTDATRTVGGQVVWSLHAESFTLIP